MCRNLTCLCIVVSVLALTGSASADIIAHWALNETSGDVAVDLSGNGHNGTIFGNPVRVAGPSGGAMEFDGVDDYITTDVSLNDLSEFTLACWIKPVNYMTNRTGLVGQNDCTEFGFQSSGNLRCYNAGAGGNIQLLYPYGSGDWHHVAATGDASGLRLYIDGQVVVGPARPPASGKFGSSAFTVNIGGAIWDPTGNWYQGQMDDVRIYSNALEEAEIKKVMT